MAFEAVQPGPGMDGAAPAGPLALDGAGRGVGEGWHGVGAAPLGERVAALPGELAVRQRPIPCLGQ